MDAFSDYLALRNLIEMAIKPHIIKLRLHILQETA